jgi:GT2 family glycosyltransferase
MHKKIAVVILNWNGKSFLDKFLPSVIEHNIPGSELVVADNASTDDSVIFLKNNFPGVSIIENKINGGFARGYNEALKKVDAEYYILLNSDVEVTAGWIEPLLELMDSDPNIAACQPKIRDFKDKTKFEHAGAAGGFIDKYGYPFCQGRIFNSLESDTEQYNSVREIFWATGACMVIRSSIFNKAGGFDEDFFAHMEEIDLCWRIKNMGYKIMYTPYSTVYHVGGGTLSSSNPRKTFLNFQNNLVLLCKNHASRFFWLKMLMRFFLDGAAGIKFFFEGDFKHSWAVVRAHFSFYRNFKRNYSKRKKLQKEILHYSKTGVYNRSIVADFYLRGIRKFSELNQKNFN